MYFTPGFMHFSSEFFSLNMKATYHAGKASGGGHSHCVRTWLSSGIIFKGSPSLSPHPLKIPELCELLTPAGDQVSKVQIY